MPVSRYRKSRRTNLLRRRRRYGTTMRKRTYKPRINRSIGLPKSVFLKMRYATMNEVNIAPAATSSVYFRLNSIYDPEEIVGGGQPYYYDQYAPMYNRYRVYGCKVEATFSCSSASSNLFHPMAMVSAFADSLPSWSTLITASCAKNTTLRRIIPGQQIVRISKYYNLPALAGVSKSEYNTSQVYQAEMTADPVRRLTTVLQCENNDGSATVTLTQYVRLTYYVKLFDLKEPAPS